MFAANIKNVIDFISSKVNLSSEDDQKSCCHQIKEENFWIFIGCGRRSWWVCSSLGLIRSFWNYLKSFRPNSNQLMFIATYKSSPKEDPDSKLVSSGGSLSVPTTVTSSNHNAGKVTAETFVTDLQVED